MNPLQQFTPFQNLSSLQQTEILKYLQTTNTQDIQAATKLLHTFQYDSKKALHFYYNTQHQHSQNQHFIPHQPHLIPSINPTIPIQQIQLAEYITLQKQISQSRTAGKILGGCVYYMARQLFRSTISCCNNNISISVPQIVKRRIYYSRFDRIYKQILKVPLQSTTLSQVLQKGTYESKPCVIIISDKVMENQADERIIKFMNRNENLEILKGKFIFYGMSQDERQLSQIWSENVQGQRKGGRIIFLFKTILNKVRILKQWKLGLKNGDEKNLSIQQLKLIIQDYIKLRRHEKNIIIRYTNSFFNEFNDETNEHLMEEQQLHQNNNRYRMDRQIRQFQQRQYKNAIQIQREKQQLARREEKKYEQLKQEKQRIKQQRKLRYLSIPDQPLIGDIIRFGFRCPNGSRIYRNFQKQQRIELLYDWVQTNLQIEFQDNDLRKFQLLRNYPPIGLVTDKHKLIKDIFQQNQQSLVIKQE